MIKEHQLEPRIGLLVYVHSTQRPHLMGKGAPFHPEFKDYDSDVYQTKAKACYRIVVSFDARY